MNISIKRALGASSVITYHAIAMAYVVSFIMTLVISGISIIFLSKEEIAQLVNGIGSIIPAVKFVADQRSQSLLSVLSYASAWISMPIYAYLFFIKWRPNGDAAKKMFHDVFRSEKNNIKHPNRLALLLFVPLAVIYTSGSLHIINFPTLLNAGIFIDFNLSGQVFKFLFGNFLMAAVTGVICTATEIFVPWYASSIIINRKTIFTHRSK